MILPRQIIGAVTALAMLLCGVACACGSAHASTGPANSVDTAPREPACHRHHGGARSSSDRLSQPARPDPCKDQNPDHPCHHCQASASPQLANDRPTVQLTPLAHFVGILDPVP